MIVVDAFDLVATLNTQARLEAAVALDLIDPNEFDEAAIGGNHVNGNPFPRLVGLVVLHLDIHGLGPTHLVKLQSMLARLGLHGGEKALAVLWSEKQAGIRKHEESAGRSRAEGTSNVVATEFGTDVSKAVLGWSRRGIGRRRDGGSRAR